MALTVAQRDRSSGSGSSTIGGPAAAVASQGGGRARAGVAAVVLQVIEWTTRRLRARRRRLRERLLRLDAFNVLFVAATLFWLENLLATSFRYRTSRPGRPRPGEASGDPGRPGHDIADPLSLVRPGLEALSFYWAFLAGLGVLAWVVLYLL